MSKKTKIKLKLNDVKTGVEFTFAHALALLRLQESQGRSDWKIADKGYEFKDNDIIRKRSNKTDKKEEE